MAVTLIDALLRQQVYYEMWKAWETASYEKKVAAIIGVITAIITAKAPADDFKDISRAQVQALAIEVVRETNAELAKTGKEIESLLKAALVTVTSVTLTNYNRTVGRELGRKRMDTPQAERTKEVLNEPAAGTGLKPREMIKQFNTSFVQQVRATIMRAYSEKWTVSQLVNYIRGTKARAYADGLANKLKSQMGAVVSTLMQHAQAWVDYNIGRLFYNSYQWCSVLDSRTTEICRSRHRKVYLYGQGPLPPAHFRCRSRIMGVSADAGNEMPNAFYDWMVRQPDDFLADVLLPADYQRVRNGDSRREDFPAYRNIKSANRATFGQRATIGENEDA